MDAWTFVWLMFLLKIPIVALFLIVRWAVRATPEAAGEGKGGTAPPARPLPPQHPRAPLPRLPRRGPHGESGPSSPARVRARAMAGGISHR